MTLHTFHISHLHLFKKKIIANAGSNSFIITGDVNARFGECVRGLPIRGEIPGAEIYTYPHIPDDIKPPNDNAYV